MSRISKSGSTFSGHRMVGSENAPAYRTQCSDPSFITVPGLEGPTSNPVPCGKCKHCRWVRRQAFANAVEMEMRDADWSLWVTLTIAPGPTRAIDKYDVLLNKALMQKFQKVCRIHKDRKTHSFAGRVCTGWRYVQCGEYGKLKGRAHYHLLVFGKGDRPIWGDVAADRIHIPEWPHGHVNVKTQVDGGVAFYISKYMQKGGAEQTWGSASNRTAIGSAYVKRLGAKLAGIGALFPTLDWNHRMPRGMGYRKALVRGSKRRDLLLSFAEAAKTNVVDLCRHIPAVMVPSFIRIERERREKLVPKIDGVVPFFVRERIKLAVFSEVRAVRGILETPDLRAGRPVRPDGWKPVYNLGRTTDAANEASARAAAECFGKSCVGRIKRMVGAVGGPYAAEPV